MHLQVFELAEFVKKKKKRKENSELEGFMNHIFFCDYIELILA